MDTELTELKKRIAAFVRMDRKHRKELRANFKEITRLTKERDELVNLLDEAMDADDGYTMGKDLIGRINEALAKVKGNT